MAMCRTSSGCRQGCAPQGTPGLPQGHHPNGMRLRRRAESSRSDEAHAPGRRHRARRMPKRRLTEPTVIVLASGAVVVMVLFVIAIAVTGDIWLVPLTALALLLIAFAIVADLRRVIGASGDGPAVETPPGRAIVVSTMPMTADEVRDALGPAGRKAHSIMVVCPAGLRGG